MLSLPEILALAERYRQDIIAIKSELSRLSWFSRGGLSYEDAHYLSIAERKIYNDMIKDHLETTKKSNIPFF